MGGLIYGWAYIRNGESVSKLVGLYMGGLIFGGGGLYSEVYGMCWPVDSSLSHSSKPMLLYVSDEIMASKPTFNLRPHASPTASTKEFSSSSQLVVVYRLAFNVYISTLLI